MSQRGLHDPNEPSPMKRTVIDVFLRNHEVPRRWMETRGQHNSLRDQEKMNSSHIHEVGIAELFSVLSRILYIFGIKQSLWLEFRQPLTDGRMSNVNISWFQNGNHHCWVLSELSSYHQPWCLFSGQVNFNLWLSWDTWDSLHHLYKTWVTGKRATWYVQNLVIKWWISSLLNSTIDHSIKWFGCRTWAPWWSREMVWHLGVPLCGHGCINQRVGHVCVVCRLMGEAKLSRAGSNLLSMLFTQDFNG